MERRPVQRIPQDASRSFAIPSAILKSLFQLNLNAIAYARFARSVHNSDFFPRTIANVWGKSCQLRTACSPKIQRTLEIAHGAPVGIQILCELQEQNNQLSKACMMKARPIFPSCENRTAQTHLYNAIPSDDEIRPEPTIPAVFPVDKHDSV
jgi:hypothetical protein